MNKRKRKTGKAVPKNPSGVFTKQRQVKNFPIVGIGASAGGLEAFQRLVKNLSGDTGMAFVLIQHLDPSHESSLTKIISLASKLPVVEARQGIVLKPNCIYVMPSNADMSLSGLKIRLTPRSTAVPHLPIDSFFQSLAEMHGANAIGVILSGTASDGSVGLKKIKSEGGITFAQDEASAKYSSMPRNAANAGATDFILPPEKIAAQFIKIARQRGKNRPIKAASQPAERDFNEIRDILRRATGVDFSNYRTTTIERRIQRRMMLNNQATITDYIEYLRRNKSEIDLLYKDIFIHVTSFFRNPEEYEFLRSKILPKFLVNKPEEPWRIWVAGCSSGEEVYSTAIVILEFLAARGLNREIQIFASDISESEIQKARAGIYSKDIEKHVTAKHLRNFFQKIDGGYKITKSIRELCVFARHDLTKDPPFSRMDLISCRNVLIYLEPVMQQKVLRTFHLSLKPTGFLILGRSESTGGASHLFEQVDKQLKVYSKRTAPTIRDPLPPARRKSHAASARSIETALPFDWQREADRLVLARHKHAGFLVDNSMKILAFRGLVTPFLEPVAGEASLELSKMVRKDLRLDLRSLLQSARKTMKPARKEYIPVRFSGEEKTITAEAIPIQDPSSKQSVFLITLEEAYPLKVQGQEKPREHTEVKTAKDRLISNLSSQLTQINEDTQVSIVQLERFNEELASKNEELESAMEELQSTNEEYESTKEQFESANEELVTLNEELQTRNRELDHLNAELTETRDYALAIIQTVREPLVILDGNLRIASANDSFYRTFGLSVPEAEHAYFFDINDRQWDVPVLRNEMAGILKNEPVAEDVEIEREFPGLGYRVMHLNVRRILQKKRKENVLVLVAIEDITARRKLEEASSTLMKEIHHRVKNNLQVVTSLLDLQSGVIQDEKAVAAFNDSRDRVRSMALIHEKIYQSTQIGKIPFREYLTELMNHEFQLYAKNSKRIELVLDSQDFYLDMDLAVPCGLIANELLSNALKYAFPEGRAGRIEIQLTHRVITGKNRPPGEFVLTVKDNGVGLPAGFDPKNAQTMGMKIVTSLTRQIGGKLEVHHDEGTSFRITFPEPKIS